MYAAMLCISLCACRENTPAAPPAIAGSGPVTVLEASYVSSGDSRAALGATSATYVVSTIEFTNDQSAPLVPQISHFSLTDRSGERFFGIDSGSSVLTGISNNIGAMKPGEKRTFVVGFRVDPTTMGTIRYDY